MTGKFEGCIADAEAQGLDKATADEARETYAEAVAAAGATLSPAEADRAAGKAVMDELAAKALREKQLTALSIRARRAALASAGDYKRARGYSGVADLGQGGKPPKDGWVQGGEPPKKGPWAKGGAMADWLKELVDGSGGLAGASGPSIKGRYQALLGSYQAKMADFIDRFETPHGLPTRGRALLDNVVREAFGEETRDRAAKALARAWEETADHARRTFNAAGGAIPKLEKWGLPQSHDPLALRALGRDGWVETIMPMLAREKMIDAVTKLPFSDKRLKAFLGEVWDGIVSLGADDLSPGEHIGRPMLANARGDHRVLAFKDAQSWLAYARKYGRGDPYATMMGHLDGMARDTAQMQVLGPNPRHQFEWLARTADAEARVEQMKGAKPQTGIKSAKGDIDSARKMYGLFTGELGTPYGPENAVARVGAATRALLSGIQLGGAVINDITSNPVFAAQVKAFAGLGQRADVRAWFGHLVSAETRKTARRTGFILESARQRHAAQVRDYLRAATVGQKFFAGANAFARLVPSWVNRASFLSSNFAAQRWAFQHEFMGRIVDLAGNDLAGLKGSKDAAERAFAAILEARGLSPQDWDKIRSVTPEEPEKGATFVSPQAVAQAHGDELGWRLAETIEREARNAVPEPSLWAQAQLLADSRPGTVKGELLRSLAAYRSFSVTQTYQWLREFHMQGAARAEAASGPNVPWQLRSAMLAAPMLTGLVLTGAMAVWLKDIVKGNDPRPVWDETDPDEAKKHAFRFWAQALAQSGGQGIFGDFFSSVDARNGHGAAMTALGAPAAFLSDTWNLTGGAVNDAASGLDPHEGRRAASYLARYSIFSSLWWSRAAWDRAVVDQLQRQIDPDAEAQFETRAQKLQSDFGETQYWPYGSVLPERAPDFRNLAGRQ